MSLGRSSTLMLGRVRALLVGLAAVLDQGLEREPKIPGRRENASATIAVEVGEIGQRDIGFDDDFFFGPQIGLSRWMDIEHQNHRRGAVKFELDVETDFDDHGLPAGGGAAEDTSVHGIRNRFCERASTDVIPSRRSRRGTSQSHTRHPKGKPPHPMITPDVARSDWHL